MSSLSKGLILLGVILAVGAGLVFWKSKVGGGHAKPVSFSSISKEELETLLADVAKVNPMALKRFKEDEKMRQDQIENIKQLLAFASEAQKEGLANEAPNKDELENIRAEVTAVTYDKELNKDQAMPAFGFITDDQVKAFWGQGEPVPKSWFQKLKEKIGLGVKDRELEFNKFLDTKIAILKAENPQMKDRQITDEEREQAREFFAKIHIYVDQYQDKLAAGEIPKELENKVDLQVKLQQAQFLARLFSDKAAEKAKVSDEDIAKYIAEHPEFDVAAKKAKAQEILDRAKNGEDFATLANEFSEDPGNSAGPDGKKNGGIYENIKLGQMVKPFEDAAMALEPGQIAPDLVETDFGYHIIKLESKKAPAEGDASTPATYTARHILISTGVKDPSNPMGRETPVKQFVRQKLEEEKQKALIDEIVASNNIQVPADFDVPEVTDQQIQDAMKKQQQMMEPDGDDHDQPGPPPSAKDPKGGPAKKPVPPPPAPKKK